MGAHTSLSSLREPLLAAPKPRQEHHALMLASMSAAEGMGPSPWP